VERAFVSLYVVLCGDGFHMKYSIKISDFFPNFPQFNTNLSPLSFIYAVGALNRRDIHLTLSKIRPSATQVGSLVENPDTLNFLHEIQFF